MFLDIVDGIKDLDEEINIDEPSWIEEVKSKFQQFMEDYERKQTVSAVPESFMANGICEKASLRFDLNTVLAGPPVNVKFYQVLSVVNFINFISNKLVIF